MHRILYEDTMTDEIPYNERLIQQFRNADKNFQESDLYLLGLFEQAASYGGIRAQEKTIEIITNWLRENSHEYLRVDGPMEPFYIDDNEMIRDLKKVFDE